MSQHFSLTQDKAYQAWRENKLAQYPKNPTTLFHTLPTHPSNQPLDQTVLIPLQVDCERDNFTLYRFDNPTQVTRQTLHHLAQQLGLMQLHANLCADEDSLSAITVTGQGDKTDYIPYTDKPLNWHTDGYYHSAHEAIQGMLLHCVHPALEGGESCWLDHEILYILLRDTDPAYIEALMHPEALTIPANVVDGKIIRPAVTGPAFSLTPQGKLHLRYSARQRNITWRNDAITQKAVQFILELWANNDSPFILRHTLKMGEGLICNNILHNRSAFKDNDKAGKPRLLYRGRYLERVNSPLIA